MQQPSLFNLTSEIQFVFLFTILNAFFLLPCIFYVSQNTDLGVPSQRQKNLPGSSLSQTHELTLTGRPAFDGQLLSLHVQPATRSLSWNVHRLNYSPSPHKLPAMTSSN